eukprot:1448267-Pyramimonas_sp.AAC.1
MASLIQSGVVPAVFSTPPMGPWQMLQGPEAVSGELVRSAAQPRRGHRFSCNWAERLRKEDAGIRAAALSLADAAAVGGSGCCCIRFW